MGGASGDPMVTRPKWPSLLKPRLISILYKPRRRPCPRKTDLERSVPLDIFLPAEATDRAADGSGAPCDGGGFECDPSRCVGVVRGQRVEIDRKKLPPIPVGPLLVPPQAVLGATRTLEIVKQASIACSMARHAAPWARQRRCAKIPSHDCSPIQSSRGHIWGDIDKLTTRYVVPPNLGVGTSSAPIFCAIVRRAREQPLRIRIGYLRMRFSLLLGSPSSPRPCSPRRDWGCFAQRPIANREARLTSYPFKADGC